MSETPEEENAQATAFDSLVDEMRRGVHAHGEAGASALSRLLAAFSGALSEADEMREGVSELVREESKRIGEQMKAHPAATISSAFAAGYMVGKAITRKARK